MMAGNGEENPTPVSARTFRVILAGFRATLTEFEGVKTSGGDVSDLLIEIDEAAEIMKQSLVGHKLFVDAADGDGHDYAATEEKVNLLLDRLDTIKNYPPPVPTTETTSTVVQPPVPVTLVNTTASQSSTTTTSSANTGNATPEIARTVQIDCLQHQVAGLQQNLHGVIHANNTLVKTFEAMKLENQRQFTQLLEQLKVKTELEESYVAPTPNKQLFPDSRGSSASETPPVRPSLGPTDLSAVLLQFGHGKPEFKFNGDPTKFHQLQSTFRYYVAERTADPLVQFNSLLGMLEGPALKKVSACNVYEPSIALKKAQNLLEESYGHPGQIEQAFLKKINDSPYVNDDAVKLQSYLDDLRTYAFYLSCNNEHAKPTFDFVTNAYKRLPRFMQENFLSMLEGKQLLYSSSSWFDELLSFIENRIRRKQCMLSDMLRPSNSDRSRGYPPNQRFHGRGLSAGAKAKTERDSDGSEFARADRNVKRACLRCNDVSHATRNCPKLAALSKQEIQDFVQSRRLCFLCLQPGHWARRCRVVPVERAENCKSRFHNKLLCNCNSNGSGNSSVSSYVTSNNVFGAAVRLKVPTVIVSDKTNPDGNSKVCRAMLDDGSVLNLCSRKLATELGLKGTPVFINLETADGVVKPVHTEKVSLCISGFRRNEVFVLDEVLIMDKLPDVKGNVLKSNDLSGYPHLVDLRVEFPDLTDNDVHLIIGIGEQNLHEFSQIRKGEYGLPWAAETPLGWIVYGKDKNLVPPDSVQSCYASTLRTGAFPGDSPFDPIHDVSSERKIVNLVDSEHFDDPFDDSVGFSVNDKKCLKTFEDSVCNVDGRWQVALPFKDENPILPNNYSVALNNLKKLGHTLNSDTKKRKFYVDYMNDLFDNSHAIVLSEKEINSERSGKIWYNPHFLVNTSGKGRIVFHCSMRHMNTCVNDILLKGNITKKDIFAILTHFRRFKYALSADIQKMFYQVLVPPDEQDFLRFLWWKDGIPNGEVVLCRMTRHSFGLTSSLSAAEFCILSTARSNKTSASPSTVDTLMHDTFVDDVFGSRHSQRGIVELYLELCPLLASDGFVLKKFATNCSSLKSIIPVADLSPALKLLGSDDVLENYSQKALGVLYKSEGDCFRFSVDIKEKALTRRGLLAMYHQLFDPIGFIQPCLVQPKLLTRTLCRMQLTWDKQIPENEKTQWAAWFGGLKFLENVEIPRCFFPTVVVKDIQLHVFSDASSVAYASVVYVRVDFVHTVLTSFVSGKVKIAPDKTTLTIPRLELLGGCLGVRIWRAASKEVGMRISKTVFWIDALSVLAMIQNVTTRFKVFVANRLAYIRAYTSPDQWRYVPTDLNSADVGSRGILPSQLEKLNVWLKGPNFLSSAEVDWPKHQAKVDETVLSSSVVCVSDSKPPCERVNGLHTLISYFASLSDDGMKTLILHYSSLRRLQDSIVYFYRFSVFLKNRKSPGFCPPSGFVTPDERDWSLNVLCSWVQKEVYGELLEHLKLHSTKVCPDLKAALRPLNKLQPFVDETGLLRVGGRFQNSSFLFDFKHPIILPSRHHFVKLLVVYYHVKYKHVGYNFVLSKLREKFWIVNGLSAVRFYLKDCIFCRIRRKEVGKQVLAPLPFARVAPGNKPFYVTSVDFFGPELVKCGRKVLKRYGCVFTCVTIRAVHLEVVPSLDTSSCINAFLRFLYSRGHATRQMYSDNATNFVATSKELKAGWKEVDQKLISQKLSTKGVFWQWDFSPPRSSHQNGICETMVKQTRRLIRAVQQKCCYRKFTDDEFLTYVKEVENIVNLRPMVPVSDDPSDFQVLSPMSLLSGCLEPTLPPGVFCKYDGYRASWKLVQYASDEFFDRWKRYYLPKLQEFGRWTDKCKNLRPGELVLLFDPSAVRNQWPRGRITRVIPDKFGVVRRVYVKTANGNELLRDVRKVCPLELGCAANEGSSE